MPDADGIGLGMQTPGFLLSFQDGVGLELEQALVPADDVPVAWTAGGAEPGWTAAEGG